MHRVLNVRAPDCYFVTCAKLPGRCLCRTVDCSRVESGSCHTATGMASKVCALPLLQEMAEAFQDAQQESIAGRTTEDSEVDLSSLRGTSPDQLPSLQGLHTACHSAITPCPCILARAAAAALRKWIFAHAAATDNDMLRHLARFARLADPTHRQVICGTACWTWLPRR